MPESSQFGAARDALALRIETLAGEVTTADDVKTLSEAFSLVAHGPQGGKYESGVDYRYSADSTARQETDYHYTTHLGDVRSQAGFQAPGHS